VKLVVKASPLAGEVAIPASKSHTIRALLMGALADGVSEVVRPLRSSDTESCVTACEALGAEVTRKSDDVWEVHGTAGTPRPAPQPIDVGNSGTTLFLAMTVAALARGETEFTGDEQIQRRSAAELMEALRALGATARSVRDNGCAPLRVGGPLTGGHVSIECPTSQYLSSLLIACPLAGGDTTIDVPLLNEAPYVRMTMQWLDEMRVSYRASDDLSRFEIPGGQRYAPFSRTIPGDFSSAAFFLVAAAVTGSRLLLRGLDMQDSQGDKAVVTMLEAMGCRVLHQSGGILIKGPEELRGGTFDLNATPDALPAMAVAGCAAAGVTRLVNVPQARAKETDRIQVMAAELGKLGARVEELPDGLVVRQSPLKGASVRGHADHRVVMALAVAGLRAEGETTVDTAEAVAVTFPGFTHLMQAVGARMESVP